MTYIYNGVRETEETLRQAFEEGPYAIRVGKYSNSFDLFVQMNLASGNLRIEFNN